MKVNRDTFFKNIQNFEHAPFTQSRGYFDSKFSNKKNYVFFLNEESDPNFGCYGHRIKIPIVGGYMVYIESICYNNIEEKSLLEFLKQLVDYDYKVINIIDDNIYLPAAEIAFRKAGFRKPFGQFGTNLSIVINLNNEFNYSRDWKRNIKIANKYDNFLCKNIIDFSDQTINEIALLFKENSETKNLSYCYSKSDLMNVLNDKKYKLFVAQINDEIIAARIIYTNGKLAHDFSTANGRKSRKVRGVTNALMDYIFCFLKENNFKYFDFSRLPIARKGAEGVSEFKLGSRGDIVKYNGEWLYTKKGIFRWGIYFINKFIRKKYEY